MQRCKQMAHKCVCISCGLHSDGSKTNFELHLHSAKHKHRMQLLRKHPRVGSHAQSMPPPGLQQPGSEQHSVGRNSSPELAATASTATAAAALTAGTSAAAAQTGHVMAPAAPAAGAAAAGSTQQAVSATSQPASAAAEAPTMASAPRLSPTAVRTAELAAQGAGVGCGVCKLQGKQPPAHFQVR
jgi:hypothetical protein